MRFIRKVSNWLLVFAMLLSAFVLPVSAESEKVETDFVDVLFDSNYLAKGASVPSKAFDLTQGTYRISGEFEVGVYTNYKFKPNENGELFFSITVDYDFDGDIMKLQKSMGVEVYREDWIFDNVVYETTVLSEKYPESVADGYYDSMTCSGVVTGLKPNKYYYIRIWKTGDGIYANIDGLVRLP